MQMCMSISMITIDNDLIEFFLPWITRKHFRHPPWRVRSPQTPPHWYWASLSSIGSWQGTMRWKIRWSHICPSVRGFPLRDPHSKRLTICTKTRSLRSHPKTTKYDLRCVLIILTFSSLGEKDSAFYNFDVIFVKVINIIVISNIIIVLKSVNN